MDAGVQSLSQVHHENAEIVNEALLQLQLAHQVSGHGGTGRAWDKQEASWLAPWHAMLESVSGNLSLEEPQLSFVRSLLSVVGNPKTLVEHLFTCSRVYRRAGMLNLATQCVRDLRRACRHPCEAQDTLTQTSPDLALSQDFVFGAEVEQAKILKAEGREQMACSLVRTALVSRGILGGPQASGPSPALAAAPTLTALTQPQRPSSFPGSNLSPGAAADCAFALGMIAEWLGDAKTTSSRVILEQYLLRAVDLMEQHNPRDSSASPSASTEAGGVLVPQKNWAVLKCDTYFQLGQFLDALFRNLHSRLRSNEWKAAAHLRNIKRREREALVKKFKSARKEEDKRACQMKIMELEKQLKMDEEEAVRVETDKDEYLRMALHAYRMCLTSADEHDITVIFRLVALWFQLSDEPTVNQAMLETVDAVPSWKFLTLVYQIASRMSLPEGEKWSPGTFGEDSFQSVLLTLVHKMANEHPYHTLPQLFALANGDRVKDKQRNRNLFVVDQDKIRAARAMLDSLDPGRRPLIKQMKQLIDLYIKVAELETAREDLNRRKPLPRDVKSIKSLPLVPVITATIAVDPTGRYPSGSFPYFCGLADSMRVMNGINAPKVVECIGSDGQHYKQLAKSGNDDLRQDAVMEQLFDLVNSLLVRHEGTRRRSLRVRTYKVVPFTPSAGVLEWVEGTVPLGEYLLGSTRTGGAHGRYGGGDWSFPRCREEMQNANDKREAFEAVCRHFRPVMHHFFLERFAQPRDWFRHRLTYTRSVAASSMVGYIVGLGDRHSMNILLDEETAEVVHIDLGVAFEQGLMLKTPERVPFRLTRDIVDGMGVCSVSGVFMRTSEAALSVMRTNKEALLTIIEVFIYDPLYKWALSPLKALDRQRQERGSLTESSEEEIEEEGMESLGTQLEGNSDATRALLRVKDKLNGFEEREVRSVPGQVQELVQHAQDPDRLCTMFPGWGAWL